MARLLAFAVFSAIVAVAVAHTAITDGPTKPTMYSTWNKALNIPSNKLSLSARRYSACGAPYFWLKFTGKKGDELMLAAGTSGARGLNGFRVSLAVFGPGLPKRTRRFNFNTPPTAGAVVINGPKNVATCDFLPATQRSEYQVVTVGGVKRCGRLEPKVTTSFFPLLYNPWKLPASGTYYFNFMPQGNYNGRFYIGTGSVGHKHAKVTLPTPPKGNAGTDDAFWNRPAAAMNCCVKGVSVAKCPARKIYA